MRILRFFFLLRFYCGSVGFLLLLSTWLLTTFDSLGFSPGRCRPVNGPSSAAVNSRQSHTAAHWLPAPAGCSLHRISPSSSTYILLHISLFRRQLHQRCHYKWQLLIVSWAIDPVVVSSITQCFILVGFCALSRSVAEFIPGSDIFITLRFQQVGFIFGFLFLAFHQGHGRLLYYGYI